MTGAPEVVEAGGVIIPWFRSVCAALGACRCATKRSLGGFRRQAQRQVAPLEALDSEAAAEGRKEAASQAAADAAGIRVQRLWVCGYCRNSNPGCPYRATRSGGWYIIVPESLVRTIEPGVAAVGLGGDYKRPS